MGALLVVQGCFLLFSGVHTCRAYMGIFFCSPLVHPWRTPRLALFGAPLEGFQGCSLLWPMGALLAGWLPGMLYFIDQGAPLEGFHGCSLLCVSDTVYELNISKGSTASKLPHDLVRCSLSL